MAAARDEGDARLLASERLEALGIEYPGLYRAADAAAILAQRQHFFAEGVQLGLNPLAAGLALLAAAGLLPLQSAVLTAVSTAVLVIMMWVARAIRWGKTWYDCRNVAEDVKTLAWRYMMQLDPFPAGLASPDVAFVRMLDDVLKHHPDIHAALARHARALTAGVSTTMQRIRHLPPRERTALYLDARVQCERRWYAERAHRNAVADQVWFLVHFVVQLTAVVAAIWLAVRLASGPARSGADNAVPVITALGAAVMGWSRSKRHGDLCSSYAATAHALAGLESTCPAEPDAQLAWMAEVETVLTREHEVWRTG